MDRGLCAVACLLLVVCTGTDRGARAADAVRHSLRVTGGGGGPVAIDSVRPGLRGTEGIGATVGTVPAGTLRACHLGRCFDEYPAGTAVQLSARPCCTVEPENPDIIALVPVKVKVLGSGRVKVKDSVCVNVCNRSYPRGSRVPLMAYAGRSGFREWRGSCGGRNAHCQVQAFRDAHGKEPSVTAVFQ